MMCAAAGVGSSRGMDERPEGNFQSWQVESAGRSRRHVTRAARSMHLLARAQTSSSEMRVHVALG